MPCGHKKPFTAACHADIKNHLRPHGLLKVSIFKKIVKRSVAKSENEEYSKYYVYVAKKRQRYAGRHTYNQLTFESTPILKTVSRACVRNFIPEGIIQK